MQKIIKFNMKEIVLSDAKIGMNYIIVELNVEEKIKKHLASLGFDKDESIQLLKYNYNKKAVLVKVMNINYAIDKNIADKVVVRGE